MGGIQPGDILGSSPVLLVHIFGISSGMNSTGPMATFIGSPWPVGRHTLRQAVLGVMCTTIWMCRGGTCIPRYAARDHHPPSGPMRQPDRYVRCLLGLPGGAVLRDGAKALIRCAVYNHYRQQEASSGSRSVPSTESARMVCSRTSPPRAMTARTSSSIRSVRHVPQPNALLS